MTSMTTQQQQQQLPSAGVFSWVRHVIVRHPVASYLIMVYAVIFPIALPSPLTRGDFLPLDLALYESLGTILGVTLPAFLGQRPSTAGTACASWRVAACAGVSASAGT